MRRNYLARTVIILLIAVLFPSLSHAQIVVDNRFTPSQRAMLDVKDCGQKLLESEINRKVVSKHAVNYRGEKVVPMNSPLLASGKLPTIYCNILNYPGWADSNYGIYTFQPSSSPTFTAFVTNPDLIHNMGGVFADGKYYFVEMDTSSGQVKALRSIFDLETQTFIVRREEVDKNFLISGLGAVYDPATKLVYAMCYTSSLNGTIEFVKINLETNTRTLIATSGAIVFKNISIDSEGNLYAISSTGDLYSINKDTGVQTFIGSTGLNCQFNQGAAIDPVTNTLYWAFFDGNTSAIYTVDLATAAPTLVATLQNQLEIGAMYIPEPEAEDDAPAAVEQLSASYNAANLYDINVSFTMPTTTFDRENTLVGGLTYKVMLDDVEQATGSAQPGEQVNLTINSSKDGQVKLSVVAANSVGNSPTSKITWWVGPDNPQSVISPSMIIEGNQAYISWSAPTLSGAHGGILETNTLTYELRRYPEGELVASNLSATSFSESIDTELLRNAYYGVTAVCGSMKSQEVYTNMERIGQYVLPPLIENFSNVANKDNFTIVDANNDNKTWMWQSGELKYSYSMDNKADDWFFTPPIRLEAGKKYIISYRIKVEMASFPEKLSVHYGTETTAESMSATLLPTTSFTNTSWETKRHELTINRTNNYTFGFHAESDKFMYSMSLTDLRIEDAAMSVPKPVENLTVTPAAGGEKQATVTFNNPTTTLSNENITSLSKVELYRGSELLYTFYDESDMQPGKQLSYVDSHINVNANYTYTVYVYNDYGKGEEASASAFIGMDVPTNPRGIKMVDNNDGTVTISWNAPTTGANGGFVDTSNMIYTVYHMEIGLGTLEIAGAIAEVSETTATVEAVLDGTPGYLFLGVGTRNDYGSSRTVGVSSVIKGTPKTPPFEESFAGGAIGDTFWWTMNYSGTSYWSLSNRSSDNDGGSFIFVSQSVGDDALVGTEKIDLKGVNCPVLIFKYYAKPGDKGELIVEANRCQKYGDVELARINLQTLTGEEGWRDYVVDLSSVKDNDYILLQFRAKADEADVNMGFDQVLVYDAPLHDLSVAVNTPQSVVVNDNLGWTATVTNMSKNTAPVYKLNTYVAYEFTDSDGNKQTTEELIETISGTALAGYGGTKQFNMTYKPTVAVGDNLILRAEVEYEADDNTANNIISSTVKVVQNEVPVVDDLTAAYDNSQSVLLRWTAPDIANYDKKRVTEDFEDMAVFPPFEIGGITADNRIGAFGDWKLYDGDGVNTYSWTGAEYPNMTAIMAYQVINAPALFDLSSPQVVASVGPHSGNQYLVSFDGLSVDGPVQNDDWLITPELPGIAQTITFFAKEITDQYGDEEYEILYSTTDSEPENFTSLGTYTATTSWEEIVVNLPQGAKYMAIRNYSFNCFGLMIDDVTYTMQGEQFTLPITGYNIYVNGQKTASVDAATTQYTVASPSGETRRYNVTVMYDNTIESPLSNSATITTAIESATVGDTDSDALVYNLSGIVVARGKKNISQLPAGVYIVRQNGVEKRVKNK